MKTNMLLSAVLLAVTAAICLSSCTEFSYPVGDRTVTMRHHPAGLPCGFPEGTLTTLTPSEDK